MHTDFDDEIDYEIHLNNLNTSKEEWVDWDDNRNAEDKQNINSTTTAREEEWRFLNTLLPNKTTMLVDYYSVEETMDYWWQGKN